MQILFTSTHSKSLGWASSVTATDPCLVFTLLWSSISQQWGWLYSEQKVTNVIIYVTIKRAVASSVFCLGSLALGKPGAMLGGCSSSPMDGSTCWGTEASGQQPPYKWAILNADWPAQVQTAWLWPHETLSWVMQPICSQMTDPQKLCKIRNAYCSFQYLSFRVICFGALFFFILLWLAKLNHLWVILMHAKIFENHWARTFIHSPNNCCLYLLCASQRAETQWSAKQTLPDLDVSCLFPSLHLPQFISFIYMHVPMLFLLLLHWQFRGDLCLVSSLPLGPALCMAHRRCSVNMHSVGNFSFHLYCLPPMQWIQALGTGL